MGSSFAFTLTLGLNSVHTFSFHFIPRKLLEFCGKFLISFINKPNPAEGSDS